MVGADMISIIVPALNEEDYIEECLKSLVGQKYSKEYEIIVVDNGSEDKTREIAEKYCDKLLFEPGIGLAQVRNKGIEEAEGDIVALTDADCIASEKWLKELEKSLKKYDLVSGPLVPIENSRKYELYFKLFYKYFLTLAVNQLGFSNAIGGNCGFERGLAKKIGGFKDSFPSDGKFGVEISKVGKITHNPDMKVYTSVRRFKNMSSLKIFMEMMEGHIRIRRDKSKKLDDSYYRSDSEKM